ncbi:MAG: hypothetical protein M3Q07_12615 [Pseudobdellovibrionaceae bacterium]|nr:hypothetical protein [Pseudobdellovibrionaceae bacterium]
MKILMALMLLLLSPIPVSAAPLSTFTWNEAESNEGLRIEGPISWNPSSCDFTAADQQVHDFPVFSYKGPSGKARTEASGAYCIQVQVPPGMLGQTLHVSMIRVFGDAELLINGERVWHQDATTGPRRLMFLHHVTHEVMQMELRLQCNQGPACGFRGALHIKDQRQGTRSDLLHYSFDLLAVTGILACFFYHLIFAFLRRRSSIALFLSINAVALIARLILSGQGQLHYFALPNEAWYWRLETLAVLVLLPSTISLVRSVFEQETPEFLSILGWVIGITGSVFLVLDARIFLFLLSLIYLLLGLIIYTYIVVITKGLRRRRSGAIIFVVCALTTLASTVFEVLNVRLNVEMHTAVQPMSYLATMIFQSVLLATRITDAYALAEHQETEIKSLKDQLEVEIRSLDQKILERTTELRTIFQSISTGILWISWNEQGALNISSEYSAHLRHTIGFDVQAWHEMHFFLRRMRLQGLPGSGKDLAQWFQVQMQDKDALDHALEKLLGGLKVFDDLDQVKHLKFKWVPIIQNERVMELFLFVFDVSLSIEMQDLALYKTMEIEALQELTTLRPERVEEFHQIFTDSSRTAIREFAATHQLRQLEHSLDHLHSEAHLTQFMQAYGRVLALLAGRHMRARQHRPFDHNHFLHMPDWQNLPVDARAVFQELLKPRGK